MSDISGHKKEIRPIYSELQGILSEAPTLGSVHDYTYDHSIWERLNEVIDDLRRITGSDYSRMTISPRHSPGSSRQYVNVSEIRTKLSGLIARLYGEYFSDEQAPFAGMPNTAIHLSQSQGQSQQQAQQMIFDFQDYVDNKASGAKDEKEKNFWSRLKSSLRNVTSYGQLATELIKAAQAAGVTIHDLGKMFM